MLLGLNNQPHVAEYMTLEPMVSEIRDLKSDLVHIRELLGVLVRKERSAEAKAEIAVRRLNRMERERDQESEAECEATLEEAPADHSKVVKVIVANMEAGGSHLQATAEEERIVDWTQDLREIRRMVEFLVRRKRKLDVKADVAVRRLERLEKEHFQLEDEERDASLPDALADRTKVVKLVVDGWFVDKGFGFGKTPNRAGRLHPRKRSAGC